MLKHTLSSLQLILRKPGVKKRPFMVRTRADVLTCARHIDSDALAPIFLTSSVTGTLYLSELFVCSRTRRQNGSCHRSTTQHMVSSQYTNPEVSVAPCYACCDSFIISQVTLTVVGIC